MCDQWADYHCLWQRDWWCEHCAKNQYWVNTAGKNSVKQNWEPFFCAVLLNFEEREKYISVLLESNRCPVYSLISSASVKWESCLQSTERRWWSLSGRLVSFPPSFVRLSTSCSLLPLLALHIRPWVPLSSTHSFFSLRKMSHFNMNRFQSFALRTAESS